MNKTQLQELAENAVTELTNKRITLFVCAENTIRAEKEYEAAKAVALTSGKIDGKNAEIREAQLRAETIHQFEAVDHYKKAEREARYNYDLAQIEMDAVRTFLRIAELPA